MTDRSDDLPSEIQQRVLSFIQEREDGTFDVPDKRGLIEFIVENADAHPVRRELPQIQARTVVLFFGCFTRAAKHRRAKHAAQACAQSRSSSRITVGPWKMRRCVTFSPSFVAVLMILTPARPR